MKQMYTLLIIMLCVLAISAETYKQVRVQQADANLIRLIQERGIDLENMIINKDQSVTITVTESAYQQLRALGLTMIVEIEDMTAYYQSLPKLSDEEKQAIIRHSKDVYGVEGFGYGSMAGYYTYQEIANNMDSMFLHYPNLITQKYSIGTSTEGRQLWAAKISKNPNIAENEPQVFFDGLIHAREPQSMATVMYYMYYLLENYGTDPEVTYLLDNREIYFVPCFNPDGYEYNRQTNPSGGGMWRLNRRVNTNGTYGVDLNRNFGYKWGYDNVGSSDIPGDETYRGPSPFSEPETQRIRDFLNTKRVKTYINYHSYNNSIIYPWGYINQLTPDSATYIEYASYMAQFNGYDHGNSYQTLGYVSNGTARDWGYGEQETKGKIYSYVFEVGGTSDGFWPAQSRIFPLAQGNLRPNLFQAWIAGAYVNLLSTSFNRQYFLPRDTVLMNVVLKNRGLSTGYNIRSELQSLNPFVTVVNSVAIVDSVPARTTAPSSTPFKFVIAPNVQLNDQLKLVVITKLGAVVMSKDTVKIAVGMPTYMFADSAANIATNWTVTATPATPAWETTTSTYTSAPSCFTDSKSGTYSASATVTMTSKNTYSLVGANSPKLRFNAKWDIEKKWDCGVVLVTTNNGSTWTPLQGQYTVPASGSGKQVPAGMPCYDDIKSNWVQEEIDLSAYSGMGIKLRFELRSDGSINKDGWYIDDIGIVVYTLPTTTWTSAVNLKDAGNVNQNIIMGTGPAATDGIDLSLGEVSLPPVPPAGVFDARFELPVTPPEFSVKDIRNDSLKSINWLIRFQPSSSGYPVTVSWDPASLPQGTFTLKDVITGTIVNVNMKTANNYIVQNSGITALKIEYRKQICADINLVSGWNMVSIPLASANMTGSAIFPSATSLIYGYNNGYVSTTTLQNGNGYWVRYGANAVSNVCGNAIFFIPIPVTAGWNMIGGHHIEVSAGAIMTTPPGIINSAVYGFSNGYQQAYSLVPGKGYWVRVTQDGTITIPTPINASKNLYSTNNSTASGYIIIKDAADNSMTLYIGNENTSKDLYDLPPVPPVGIFDVRFGDNSSFSRFGINYINTQGLSYPITISASGVSLTLRDAVTNGKNFNAQVNSGNTFVLKSDIGQIEIESRSAPTDFALYQNYPNPFNPETKINFSLPVKGNVKLTVFNQLGEQAAVLADKSMDAGAHEMLWNASDLPSGIYYIELRANELRAVQKAVLIK